MIIYLNMKTVYGIETVDELDSKDFKDRKSLGNEAVRLIGEYAIAGMHVYRSQRSDKTWRIR